MKKITNIIFAILLTASLAACTEEVETTNRAVQPLKVVVTAENFISADGSSTRATDTGYATSFATGNQIGIFAITPDGEILDKNIPYQYNGASWTPVVANRVLYQYNYATVNYVAYYPYSAAMDDATSESDIISKFTPLDDQSTQENYTNSDLMTCTSSITTSEGGGDPVLKLTMKHRMSLFALDIKSTVYVTSDGYKYFEHIGNLQLNITATSGSVGNDISAKMYQPSRNAYRYIALPRTTINAQVGYNFDLDNVDYSYTASITSMAAGKYNLVDIHKKEVQRDLEIGDFFYRDGTFYPGSTTKNAPWKDDCVGVVAYVYKTGDASNYIGGWRHNSSLYPHGMVVGKMPGSMSSWNNRNTEVPAFTKASLSLTSYAQTGGWLLPDQVELSYICSGVNAASQGGNGTNLKTQLNPYITQAGGTPFTNVAYLSESKRYSGSITIRFSDGSFHYDSTQSGYYYVTLAF